MKGVIIRIAAVLFLHGALLLALVYGFSAPRNVAIPVLVDLVSPQQLAPEEKPPALPAPQPVPAATAKLQAADPRPNTAAKLPQAPEFVEISAEIAQAELAKMPSLGEAAPPVADAAISSNVNVKSASVLPAAPVATVPPQFDAAYLDNPRPAYPPAARRRGDQGRVQLRVLVSKAGLAERVELHRSSGSAALDQAARTAVERWRFVPARRGHETLSDWVIVPILFSLNG